MEGRWTLCGFEDAKPSARPGAKEKEPSAPTEGARHEPHRAGDLWPLSLDRAHGARVFTAHQAQELINRERIEGAAVRIGLFGGQRLVARHARHRTNRIAWRCEGAQLEAAQQLC